MFLVCTFFNGLCQVLYCLLVGTFPFNSFLAGFISTLGVFIFTGLHITPLLIVAKISVENC